MCEIYRKINVSELLIVLELLTRSVVKTHKKNVTGDSPTEKELTIRIAHKLVTELYSRMSDQKCQCNIDHA